MFELNVKQNFRLGVSVKNCIVYYLTCLTVSPYFIEDGGDIIIVMLSYIISEHCKRFSAVAFISEFFLNLFEAVSISDSVSAASVVSDTVVSFSCVVIFSLSVLFSEHDARSMRSARRKAVILLVFSILHLSVKVLFSLLFTFTISLYNMFYIDFMSIITDISFYFFVYFATLAHFSRTKSHIQCYFSHYMLHLLF